MSERPLTADQLAREFHDTYEQLAPTFDYQTRPDSRTSWDKLPEPNRMLMVATAAALISKLGLKATRPTRDRGVAG